MSTFNFTAKWGESFDLPVTISDDDGDPFDLTEYDVKWRVGDDTEKTEGAGITITDATGGVVTLHIEPADTEMEPGKYRHELRIFENGDVRTVLVGTMTVRDSLYRE